MNHLKENPVGIDKAIQEMQKKLYAKLGLDIDGYGRAYLIDREGKTAPFHFISGKDYREILVDDSKKGKFFFVETPRSTYKSPRYSTEVDVIFLLDLKKLKPNIAHRADEEVRAQIHEAINKIKFFQLRECIKGINALSDFDTGLLDMQPYHFLKFKGVLNYQINC